MIDMRGEEETILPPHSQVRHELMHNQYNRMKEEDDHWQDVSSSGYSDLFLYFYIPLCMYFFDSLCYCNMKKIHFI